MGSRAYQYLTQVLPPLGIKCLENLPADCTCDNVTTQQNHLFPVCYQSASQSAQSCIHKSRSVSIPAIYCARRIVYVTCFTLRSVQLRTVASSGCAVAYSKGKPLLPTVYLLQVPARLYTFKRFYTVRTQFCGPGSSVGLVTELRAGRFGDRIPVRVRFSATVQTGPGADTASCTMGTRSFPGGKERPGRDADPSPPSSSEVLEEYSYISTPLWATTGPVTGLIYLFRTQFSCGETFLSSYFPLPKFIKSLKMAQSRNMWP